MPWVYKGNGKGWGKGGSKPPSLPDDFVVDPTREYIGTVIAYYKFQGYGFIAPDQAGLIPNDKVFVHWKSLISTDRYPSLSKDMQVQFRIQKIEKQGVMTLQADHVTGVGGQPISTQDIADSKKTFVGGQNLRYTGTLKFFVPQRGFGYIKIDEGFQYDKEGVPEEIRVETAEMNCGGGNPKYMESTQVEFGIWLTTRGAFKAYNVTLPGGLPLPLEEQQQS